MSVFSKAIFNPNVFLTDFEDAVVTPPTPINQAGSGNGVGGGAQDGAVKRRKKNKELPPLPNERRILYTDRFNLKSNVSDRIDLPVETKTTQKLTSNFISVNLAQPIADPEPIITPVIAKPKIVEDFYDLDTLALTSF